MGLVLNVHTLAQPKLSNANLWANLDFTTLYLSFHSRGRTKENRDFDPLMHNWGRGLPFSGTYHQLTYRALLITRHVIFHLTVF